MSECPMCGFDDEALSDSDVENSVVCYRCVIEKAKAARGTTQVQTMTNQELNRKLAELMGYTVYHREDLGLDFYRLTDPSGIAVQGFFNGQRDTEEEAWLDIPHFCSDPAASLEVQTAAVVANKLAYLNNLLNLVSPGDSIEFGLGGTMEVVGYNIDGTSAMLTATPRERAEAAYITLSSKQ